MIWTLTAHHAGQRIDKLLVQLHPGTGRAEAARLCADGRVRLDGRRVGKGEVGRAGGVLSLDPPAKNPQSHQGLALPEIYLDAALVVVDKPAGMPSHPLRPEETGTAAQILQARYPEMVGIGYSAREAGLVHRLDTGTGGLLLAARTADTFQRLRALLVAGQIEKHYRALCTHPLPPGELTGWLDARGAKVRLDAGEQPHNRAIRLEILACEPLGPYHEIEVRVAHAGRHQVRVQLAAAGAPLVGDALYGGPAVPGLDHHALHASRLAFTHPLTGAFIDLRSAPAYSWL